MNFRHAAALALVLAVVVWACSSQPRMEAVAAQATVTPQSKPTPIQGIGVAPLTGGSLIGRQGLGPN